MTQNGMTDEKRRRIKKPMSRTVLIGNLVFFTVFSIVLLAASYAFVFSSLYGRYNAKLEDIITFVEHIVDADDLRVCLETKTPSEKYDRAQRALNCIVDDFELDYLYLVIPSDEVMINAISATSEAERAAGETDMPIWETTDAYSHEELQRYRSFWNADGVRYFEESSGYGAYYTACKPLRDSGGETVALICADVSIESLHRFIRLFMHFGIAAIGLICGISCFVAMRWIRRTITDPIFALEESSHRYVKQFRQANGAEMPRFELPPIKTPNEVRSLAETMRGMAEDTQKYIREMLAAQEKAQKAEEEAKAAAKIAALTSSMSSLLTHMPAMTFSKDVQTGQYLACNQAFADYAHKPDPEGVIGLTDHEIFDQKTADHFVQDDRKAMTMDAPYVFYEDVVDAQGKPCQLQTTKLKFTDAEGRLCLLGMSVDVTELMTVKRQRMQAEEAYEEAKSASITYSNIAQTLSTDYFNIFYVDLDTERFIEYTSHTADDDLVEERHGENFFAESHEKARIYIHPDDQEAFIRAFTKENVIRALDENGAFTLQYRLMTLEGTTHVSMKATRKKGSRQFITIGVNSIESQMRQQEAEERVKEERTTYARISALSGDYIAIYTVDPVTNHYTEYAAGHAEFGLGLAREGEDFFRESQRLFAQKIYVEDLEKLITAFTQQNVLYEIARKGMFVLDYRLMIDGIPTYVRLKAALVEEKDGPQIIIGVINIDEQVRREQEYASNLTEARNKANLDALTGVKNKHAYIDIEEQLNHQIEERRHVEFAIVVFDVNNLKEVNDTQGHQAGDRYIRQASDYVCSIFKHSPVFRVGGDEFAVIAQGRDYANIDELIATIQAGNEQGGADGIIIACGMARYENDRSVSAVFERADQHMYENKKKLKS